MVDDPKHFILNDTFPDAGSIFKGGYKSVDDIKSTALVSLDTSVLLAPYKLGSASFTAIISIYEALAKAKRLVLPGHVAREYLRRRASELASLVKLLRDQSSRAGSPAAAAVPILEQDPDYTTARKLAQEIDDKVKEARKALDKVIERLSDPVNGDPILARYAPVFADAVFDLKLELKDRKAFDEECAERFSNSIPPGYHDEGKTDNAGGDLLIWKTIIEAAKSKKRDMIFVTGDEKGDWWVRSDRAAFQPRYELLDEFRRHAEGRTIQIVPLHRMIEIFEGTPEAVAEAEQLERFDPIKAYVRREGRDPDTRLIRKELMHLSAMQGKLENDLAALPVDHNDSPSLPWNRAFMQIAAELAAVKRRKVALRNLLKEKQSGEGAGEQLPLDD